MGFGRTSSDILEIIPEQGKSFIVDILHYNLVMIDLFSGQRKGYCHLEVKRKEILKQAYAPRDQSEHSGDSDIYERLKPTTMLPAQVVENFGWHSY